MKKTILILLTLTAIVLLSGCVQQQQPPLVGESCGTVSPDSRDACCASKMKDAIHPMCVGGWKYNPANNMCGWECAAEKKITSFEECVAAGNPVMESYPRQCRADGQLFVEDIDEPIEPLIGGQRDEHGCLGPAGYSWSEEIEACTRNWELDDAQKKAAKIAVEHVGPEYGLTVVEVMTARCPGCFTVKLSNAEQEQRQVTLADWKVTEGISGANVVFPEDCVKQGGRVVNVVGGFDCEPGEEKIGDITVFISPHICCK